MLLAGLSLGGCIHSPTDVGVEDAMEGTPYRLFPELATLTPDSPWLGGSVPPSPTVEPCVALSTPDADWRPMRAHTSSRWVSAVSLRVPPGFAMREVLDLPPDAEEHGGILVASWADTTDDAGSARGGGANLAIWVGPEPGYPTVGADTAVRQTAVAECTSASPVAGARVITFTLVGARGTSHYLAMVWPVAPARYLRVLASASRPETVTLLRRAVGSIQVEPRTP